MLRSRRVLGSKKVLGAPPLFEVERLGQISGTPENKLAAKRRLREGGG